MSDFFKEHAMYDDEDGDWYKDPRIWVIVLAIVMFILTAIDESMTKYFLVP